MMIDRNLRGIDSFKGPVDFPEYDPTLGRLLRHRKKKWQRRRANNMARLKIEISEDQGKTSG